MNDVQRNRILELFESNFEDGNIKEYFNNYEVIYPDIMPILKEEGYNVEAINDHTQLSKIDFKVQPRTYTSYEDWAKLYIAHKDLENKSDEDADADIHDYDIFNFIIRYFSMYCDLDITINETPEEFLNQYPTLEFFQDEVMKKFSKEQLIQYAKDERYYLESDVKNHLRDIQFPEQDPSKVRYDVKGYELLVSSYEDLIEGIYEYYTTSDDEFNLSQYAGSSEMYDDFLVNAQFEIEILDEPEDFENEEEY